MLRCTIRLALKGEARCLAAGAGCLLPEALGDMATSVFSRMPTQATAASALSPPQATSLLSWRRQWGGQFTVRGFSSSSSSAAVNLPGEDGRDGQPRPDLPPSSADPTAPPPSKQVVYKGKGIRLFRLLVRMKVFQLTGVAALAVPINTFLSQGEVSGTQAVIASALLVGSAVASTALWYYSKRYVGELAVLRDSVGRPTAARFSVLDFWGNREDNDIKLDVLVPPLQGVLPQVRAAMLQEPLIPVDVEGDRQYFLSLRYGQVVDKQLLLELLEGRLAESQHGGKGQGEKQPQHAEAASGVK